MRSCSFPSDLTFTIAALAAVMVCFASDGAAQSQTPEQGSGPVVQIADDPKAIDPATLVHPRLAERVTVQFEQSALKDVYRWLQDEHKLSVAVDAAALREAGILSSELVSDRLNDEPLYLLLDRLASLKIGWYMVGDELQLTTLKAAAEVMSNESFNLGEYFDGGFEQGRLMELIPEVVGGEWIQNGDEHGDAMLLGDVVFLRQNAAVNREVRGLLAALKTPARRVLTLDAPQNAVQRLRLSARVTIQLKETPLDEAVRELSRLSGADLRLNQSELAAQGVRSRTPITLEMNDQKLSTTLKTLLSELDLTWLVQDGVIWVVRPTAPQFRSVSALFDVRDLCRNEQETVLLMDALYSQAGADWVSHGDESGTIAIARSGIIVVRNTMSTLDEITELLNNYRIALKGSKRRDPPKGKDPKEVVVHYYQVPTAMAADLVTALPEMVRTETWRSEAHPDAAGTIRVLKSTDALRDVHVAVQKAGADGISSQSGFLVQNSVLVIRQQREVHLELQEFIDAISNGDLSARYKDLGGNSSGGSVGGQGGGGFGGGFGGGGLFSTK
jgi:hypothetical protein